MVTSKRMTNVPHVLTDVKNVKKIKMIVYLALMIPEDQPTNVHV
jgi:hypothetical protein